MVRIPQVKCYYQFQGNLPFISGIEILSLHKYFFTRNQDLYIDFRIKNDFVKIVLYIVL